MFIFIIVLTSLTFLFFLSIVLILFYKIKNNEKKSCKNCVCLKENNYCLYLKKTVEDLDKVNCKGIIL